MKLIWSLFISSLWLVHLTEGLDVLIPVVQITEFSKVNETALRMTLDTVIEPPQKVYVVLFLMDASQQFSETTKRSDDSNLVFEFALPDGIPIFIEETNFTILCNVVDENENPVMFGELVCKLKKMDTRQVTIVGANLEEFGTFFVRVDTGNLDFITIGAESCTQQDTPCYFQMDSSTSQNFKWCTDVINESETSLDTISQCNEEITSFEAISEEDSPALLLLDKQILTVFYSLSQAAVEVLTLDSVSGNLTNNSSINCVTVDDNSCNVLVNISESRWNVHFIIVFFDEEGYVNSSRIYPFTIIPIELEYHINDAIYISWTSDIASNFTILASKGVNANDIKFQMSVVCGEEVRPCFAYFISLEEGDIVSLQKEEEMNFVATAIMPLSK